MKNNLFLSSLLAAMCMICTFTSCSSDDDNDAPSLSVADVVGTYSGELMVMGTPVDAKVVLKEAAGGQLSVVLKNFAFMGIPVGDVETMCAVSPVEGKLKLDGSFSVTVPTMPGSIPVSLSGYADGNNLDLNLGVTFGSGMVVTFSGSKSDDNGSDDASSLLLSDVEGTYLGELMVMDTPVDAEVVINGNDENSVKIILKDFAFMGLPIGDVEAVCEAVLEDGKYNFSGSVNVTVPGIGELPVAISGAADGASIALTISVAMGAAPLEVYFSGVK